MAARSGIRYGLNTGHPTTPRETRPRPSRTKGKASKRTTFVRSIVREVSGFAPYERRCMELIRNGADKKARKLAKKRLGTLRRAKRKTEDLTNIIAEMRRQGH